LDYSIELTLHEGGDLVDRILQLKKERRAIILAHNYQELEIQDLADCVDDSVGLARRAMEAGDAEVIVLCGVDFMAETVHILNPGKRVLIPHPEAKCPMAQMLPAELVKCWRGKYPGAPVVLYVNTLGEARAYADVCCTSANADRIVSALDSDIILFGPDVHLARYVEKRTGKRVIPIPPDGHCPIHIMFTREGVLELKRGNPDALFVAHPECVEEVQELADFIGSTTQMCRFVRSSTARKFIIGTEVGLMHRLRKENPSKEFVPAHPEAICKEMKFHTLEAVYLALRDMRYVVELPREVADRARVPLLRMFELIR